MTMTRRTPNMRNQNGVIAIMTILWVSLISLAAITTVALIASAGFQIASSSYASERTFNVAEAGLNDALYKLATNPNQASFNSTLDGIHQEIVIAPIGLVSPKTVTAVAADPISGSTRTLELEVHLSSFTGFGGAVISGNGGFAMKNGSNVSGNVCANGNVTGLNNSKVTGNITVAGSTGGVPNYIDNVTILSDATYPGNATAHTIQNKTSVAGDAYYTAVSPDSTVAGSACTGANTHCHPASPDPDLCKFPPIADSFTDKSNAKSWYQEALAGCPGGLLTNCPGPTSVPKNTEIILGPTVINGDLTLLQGSSVRMTGTVWVIGKITFQKPGGSIFLNNDPLKGTKYGDKSGAIVAENVIDLKNNGTFNGSGELRSYIVVTSLSPSNSPAAIDAANNNQTAVFFAPKGTIHLSNGLNLNNATGNTVALDNATVTYNSNLEDLLLLGGTSIITTPKPGTWREL